MSVSRYPAYQDSGVEWLGEVPAHWTLRRLGYYLAERREKVSDRDFPALSVTKNGIVPQLETAAKTDDGDNRKRVCTGDFVINGRSDRKGSSGLSALDGSVSLINIVLYPHQPIEMEFVGHLLKSPVFQEEFYRYGKGIVADLWSTNFSEMRNILLAVPPPAEQSAIAAFLDRETGKIDALVAEQERLIGLLKEKRQSVVYGAMTTGAAHAPRTKPSGVGTPAFVPEHWEVLPLTRVVRQFVDYRGSTPNKIDDGIPLITATQIKEGRIDHALDPVFISEAEYASRMTRGFPALGDVLLTTEAPLGEVAQIEDTRVAPGQRMILLKADEAKIRSDFLFWHFRSDFGRKELWTRASGSTASGIRSDRLRASAVLVPPLEEQDRIVAFIRDALAKFAGVEAEVQKQICLLQERRAALISAAVTGKIDVRGLVPAAQEAA
ncbi:restriction endonuclease subunit S [Roseomonas sp. HJA6]|uniref:Restriction endonuclease subunit S n=1 Tax=Roseomonas alba TaxID=2846776 RepID=A0ABS7A9P2_9PROT|nr:restriction endonuclease subunit S [Neoroseomonas alba]MBW6398888.1 restriction endonuclease subunit S [Neoroseomonas alba]